MPTVGSATDTAVGAAHPGRLGVPLFGGLRTVNNEWLMVAIAHNISHLAGA